jgi:hypothetical protein
MHCNEELHLLIMAMPLDSSFTLGSCSRSHAFMCSEDGSLGKHENLFLFCTLSDLLAILIWFYGQGMLSLHCEKLQHSYNYGSRTLPAIYAMRV